MTTSIGSLLAWRLMLPLFLVVPLGLLGVQEIIFLNDRADAIASSHDDATGIVKRMEKQQREDPPAIRLDLLDYYQLALSSLVDESRDQRNRIDIVDQDGPRCDWRRDTRVYFLFSEGKPKSFAKLGGGLEYPGSTIENFERNRVAFIRSGIRNTDEVSIELGARDRPGERQSLCLNVSSQAAGVLVRFNGGEFVVARMVAFDWAGYFRLLGYGLGFLIALAMLLGLITWAFNRSVIRRVKRIAETLDVIERDRFTQRVPIEGGLEFAALGNAINAMIERVGAAQAHLSQVNAYVAHNLRTPVKVAQDLLDGVTADLPDIDAADLDEIRRQLVELQRRCTQLLEVTKLEMDAHGELTQVHLGDLLTKLIDDVFEYVAEARDIRLDLILEQTTVLGREDMFELLIDNILQNALKFATSGTVVSVSLRNDGSDVLMEVANRGPEVSADLRERIFEQGVTTGGNGLGLYVVRMVARRHGGDAWAADEPGGFRLIVRLPRAHIED